MTLHSKGHCHGHACAYGIERLEDRVLLTGGWVEQGPGPITYSSAPQYNSVGDVAAVAPDPINPDRLFAAAINGGIWRTDNARAASPEWFPLTDALPSLATSMVVFDPADSTRNTLYAGYGNASSFFNRGGLINGLIKTTDGEHWSVLPSNGLQNTSIRRIIPTTLPPSPGRVILVATQFHPGASMGVFRSTDDGASFSNVLPGADEVRADPTNPNRFFAAVPGAGVFRSNAGGAANSWQPINNGMNSALLASSTLIEIAINRTPDPNTGFANMYAVVAQWPNLSDVYRSTDGGATWTSIGIPAGFIYKGELSMLSHRANQDVVYLASVNGTFRWNGGVWQPLGGGPTNNTFAHADARHAEFDADGNVIEADDGGVYKLLDPDDSDPGVTRQWVPLNGWPPAQDTLRVAELIGVAYDSVSNVYLAGTWDNGNVQQAAPDSLEAVHVNGGDGGFVAVDSTSLPGRSIRYFNTYNAGASNFIRMVYDANNQPVGDREVVPLLVNGQSIFTVDPGYDGDHFKGFALNRVTPMRMAIFAPTGVYESFDGGNTLAHTSTQTGFQALAYGGGELSAQPNPDVIYAATATTFLVRTAANGAFATVGYPHGGFEAGTIEVDPYDWRRAFVADASHRKVYRTDDAGATWTELTGNLLSGVSDPRFRAPNAVVAIPSGSSQTWLAAATRDGVFFCYDPVNNASQWQRLGTLPKADVLSLVYNRADDVLIAGTVGRGAFKLVVHRVTNTNDSGPGSLRQALQFANSDPDLTPIPFDIPASGPHFIAPATPLPPLTAPVILDAATQMDYVGAPLIELRGTALGAGAIGLALPAGSTVRGIAITQFGGDGISLSGSGSTVQNCFIGVDPSGDFAPGNGGWGINALGQSHTLTNNVIGGNALGGILVRGRSNDLRGNHIGVDISGTHNLANGGDGVRVSSPTDGRFNVIGSTDVGAGNVIQFNAGQGIHLLGTTASNNVLAANIIGGLLAGNGGNGILVSGASNNTIGGIEPAAGNTIAYNGAAGIAVTGTASRNASNGNRIYANAELGIDLGADGVTANDPGDSDTGPNNLQNFPAITSITGNALQATVNVSLSASPNTVFRIDLFSSGDASPLPDATGFGEGEIFWGSTTLMTNASGSGTAAIAVPSSLRGTYVTATATDPFGNSSEFSAAFAHRSPASGDPDFGTNGVSFPVQAVGVNGTAIALQGSGRIVVAGYRPSASTGLDYLLVALKNDGTIDTSFGSNGAIQQSLGSGDDKAFGVAVSPIDQSIYIVGSATVGANKNFGIVSYTKDGAINTAFNAGNPVLTAFPSRNISEAMAVLVQPDGKLVVVGHANTALGIARYTTAGALDATFGTNGLATIGGSIASQASGFGVALQSDGKIVVVGSASTSTNPDADVLVARYLNTGQLDSTFGSSGSIRLDASGNHSSIDTANTVTIQSDGSIVVGGNSTAGGGGKNFLLTRFSATGSLDTSFGNGGGSSGWIAGVAIKDFHGADDGIAGVAIQSDGKIVVGGSFNDPATSQQAVFARYFASGQLETSVFQGPFVNTANFSSGGAGNAMALDGDGRILLAGTALGIDTQFIGVARFLPGRYRFNAMLPAPQSFIEAENYDNGGPGFAYADTSPLLNEAGTGFPFGSIARPGTGVDVELNAANTPGPAHLAYVMPGEWAKYTVSVPASGLYDLQFRVSSLGQGGTLHLEVDDVNVTGPITIPNTGGFLNFTTLTLNGEQAVPIAAGTHVLRVSFDTPGGFFVGNLDWLRFGDLTAPSSTSNAFVYNSGPPQRFTYQFSEDVSASLSLSDFQVRNITTGTNITAGAMALSYNSGTNVATLTFPGFADGALPDGRYTATLFAAGVTDAAGNPLPANIVSNFTFLRGDADANGQVSLADFNILASNFGLSGRTFSQGDFNYDSSVNLADFNILAGRFGTSLAPTSFGRERVRFDGLGGDDARIMESLREELLS